MTPGDLPPWAARQAALLLGMLEKTVEAVQQGQPADRTLHEMLSRDKKFGSRDRRLMRDSIFAWFRWHGAVGTLPLPHGLCAAWALEGQEWPPALQAILLDLGWDCPDLLSEDIPLETRRETVSSVFPIELSPVSDWLPAWFREETAHLGPWEDRIQEHLHRPPTWIRVDPSQQADLHQTLLDRGARWAGETSPCAYAFDAPGPVHQCMQQHPEAIEIQDLASQQVARICAPTAGQSWWDACCGAGGKSLQLLVEAGRDLDLTCTDRREGILTELTKRGRRHGLAKVRRYPLDLLKEPTLPNITFDGILVDAPCSGSGTWSRNPDDAWRTEAKDVDQHGRRQFRMLQAVLPALKSGGVLVYAVCSVTKTETLDVLKALLEAQPDLKLDPFAHPLTGETTDGTLTLLPGDHQADGMYIARLVKGQ